MSETFPVKERIEAQLLINLTAAMTTPTTGWLALEVAAGRITSGQASAVVCERWSDNGQTPGNFDLMLAVGDEEIEMGAQGDIGETDKTLPCMVWVTIARPESQSVPAQTGATGTEPSALVHNRWLGRIEKAVMADTHLTDGGGNFLSWDILPTATSQAPVAANQQDFVSMFVFDVKYSHPRNDPYTVSG